MTKTEELLMLREVVEAERERWQDAELIHDSDGCTCRRCNAWATYWAHVRETDPEEFKCLMSIPLSGRAKRLRREMQTRPRNRITR